MPEGPPVPFSDLPLSKTHDSTKLNAWGAYGDQDERGFLNRQTDTIVAAAAASEIKTGIRVSLNAALDFQGKHPRTPLAPPQHHYIQASLTHPLPPNQATAPSSAAKSSKKTSTKRNRA